MEMYKNNPLDILEPLHSRSVGAQEPLRKARKSLRKSQGWICPICSLKSTRHYNVQRHINRQHGGYCLPLDMITMETRGEKFIEHLARSNKYVGYASDRVSPKDLRDNCWKPHASDCLSPLWPSVFFRKERYTGNLESLNSMSYKFTDYPSLIYETLNDSACCGNAGILDSSLLKPKARPITRPVASATLIFPAQSSFLHDMSILREYCGCTGFPTLSPPGTAKSLEHSEKRDEMVAAYQVKTCHRCLTTDPILVRFQRDGTRVNDLSDLLQRESLSYRSEHLCDEQHYRDVIIGSSPKEIERMKNCIEKEKQSGDFLFKAINSGPWTGMCKFVVAIKVSPIVTNDKRVRVSINSQMPVGIPSNCSIDSAEYQQDSSNLIPVSASINIQEIPIMDIPDCHTPTLNGAIHEGVRRLDDKGLIKFCKLANDSSIVLVSVNNSTCEFDINEKNKHANAGFHGINHTKNITDYSMNKTQADLADAYIEAALGRKMFLFILTPYPKIYAASSFAIY